MIGAGSVVGMGLWKETCVADQAFAGPSYTNSYAICISNAGLGVLMTFGLRWHLQRENKRLDAEERERGDEVQGFRYVL